MMEQARQEMAEEDLGGGMFDEDVTNMREGAARCLLPQHYTAEERQTLDMHRAAFDAPEKEPKKYKTGTKLYQAQLADDGHGTNMRVQAEVRAPPEQIVAWWMGNVKEFNEFMESRVPEPSRLTSTYKDPVSDHSVTARVYIPVPSPLSDREIVLRTLWEKLDDNTFFVTQASVEDAHFPRRDGVVRMTTVRTFKFTKISPKLTKFEYKGSASFGGSVPRSISNAITRPAASNVSVWPTM
jgi:hypothetical protein